MSFDKEKFKEECNRRRDANLGIGGKTFDVKEDIKQLGGIWDGMKKIWLMPSQEALDKVKGRMGMETSAPAETQPEAAPRHREPGDDDDREEPLIIDNTPF